MHVGLLHRLSWNSAFDGHVCVGGPLPFRTATRPLARAGEARARTRNAPQGV